MISRSAATICPAPGTYPPVWPAGRGAGPLCFIHAGAFPGNGARTCGPPGPVQKQTEGTGEPYPLFFLINGMGLAGCSYFIPAVMMAIL